MAAFNSLTLTGSLQDLIPALSCSDERLRTAAIAHLFQFGPEALPAYTIALNDPKATNVSEAENALAEMGPRAAAAIPALTKTLHHPSFLVRMDAISALERIAGADALPTIAGMMDDPDPRVRDAANQAIDRLRQKGEQ